MITWRTTLMLADVKSIDWKDDHWSHVEGNIGYSRERTGADLDISVVHVDGILTTHKVTKGQFVTTGRGELRLP